MNIFLKKIPGAESCEIDIEDIVAEGLSMDGIIQLLSY